MKFERLSIPGRPFLHVEIGGEGPVIALLQYYRQSTARHFEEVIPILLDAGYTVMAVDPRGVGGNPGDLDGLTLHDLASDLSAVIESAALGPAHVVGAAYAASVARCLAADMPSLVCSLCLVSPGAIGDVFAHRPSELALATYHRIYLESDPDLRLAAIQDGVYSAHSTGRARSDDYEVSAQQALHLLAAANATPKSEYWTAGKADVLLLQGLDDLICPPANSRDLSRELGPRAQLVEVPGAAHMVAREKSGAFVEAVEFMRMRQAPRNAGS